MSTYKFDWAYLKFLAQECQAAYEQPPDLEADGVEVRVTEDDHGNLIFTARGTTFDGTDIIRDMRTVPWYSQMLQTWCHRGFLLGARAILPLIVEELKQHDMWDGIHEEGEAPYLLNGHSKGGSEMTLVAAYMVDIGLPPRALVTYGAPYAGGAGLRRWLKDVPGHRVVNQQDPVPTVPWLLNKLGVFDHPRGETQVDTNINSRRWPAVENHRINNYIDALGYTPHG